MIALAILGSVATAAAASLVAWRWYLAHLTAERGLKSRDIDAEMLKVTALDESVRQLEKRLQQLEIRTAGR